MEKLLTQVACRTPSAQRWPWPAPVSGGNRQEKETIQDNPTTSHQVTIGEQEPSHAQGRKRGNKSGDIPCQTEQVRNKFRIKTPTHRRLRTLMKKTGTKTINEVLIILLDRYENSKVLYLGDHSHTIARCHH